MPPHVDKTGLNAVLHYAKDIIYILTFIGTIIGGVIAFSNKMVRVETNLEYVLKEIEKTRTFIENQLILNGQVIENLKED